MEAIGDIWLHTVVSPLTDVLAILIGMTGNNAALGIIAFTLITRIILLPLGIMQVRSQKKMMALQPELKAIQKRYAKDAEKRAQEQMKLYKDNGVQPALGCLPLLLQMPILFGLYAALSNLAHYNNPIWGGQWLTDFQRAVAPTLSQAFLYLPCGLSSPDGIPIRAVCEGLLDPSNPAGFLQSNFFHLPLFGGFSIPGPMLLVMTALSWVVQRMMIMPTADPQQQQMNKMMAFMPLMYLFFFSTVPAGLVLYWLITNLFSIAQQWAIAGPGSLLPRNDTSDAAPAAAASVSLAKPNPEPNGAGDDAGDTRAPERRAAPRSGRRRKSGRR